MHPGKGALLAGTVLLLVASARVAAAKGAAPLPALAGAVQSEWAEWGPFAERLRHQAELDAAAQREPDTEWLKTCAGWTAQEMCSSVFGSGIDEATAFREDVGYIPANFTEYWINYDERSVVAGCLLNNPNNQTYKSIWREGLGCTLVERLTEAQIRAQNVGDQTPPTPLDPNVAWPVGEGFFPERAPPGLDMQCVRRVVADQFSDVLANPRAIVVVYKGQLVHEQYKRGITKESKLIGWSATKSLTQALVAVLVKDGLLDIYRPANVPEWYESPNDGRQNITVDMMLRMSSGTRWVGDLPPTTECIFYSNADCAHTSALQPLVWQPDTKWNYNSGSTYIMSRIVLETRGDRRWTNFEWPKRRLFYPIGAHSMYIEYQPNEIFLGGAYGYGTARDWARFGLLYMNDGVWVDGTRILPEGWVKYTSTPTPDNESYGAHFWRLPGIDERIFKASGFRNQDVFILPGQELVIVRLAMPPLAYHPFYKEEDFVRSMLACLV